MKIPPTISVIRDGVCIIECDVIANIDYKRDRRHGELEWWVDEYTLEGRQTIWNKAGQFAGYADKTVVIPKNLAEVFNEHLDRDWMDEKVRENLADYADDRADYLRDQLMDR